MPSILTPAQVSLPPTSSLTEPVDVSTQTLRS